MGHHELAIAQLFGSFDDTAGHLSEGFCCAKLMTQRVKCARIITAGDDDHIGLEARESRQDDLVHCLKITRMASARRQGDIHIVTKASPAAFVG